MICEIEIVRGTTNNFTIEIKDTNGEPYKPSKGDKIVFGVKKDNIDSIPIVKVADIEADGTANITLKPEDTVCMCCDNYSFDVGLKTGDDYYIIIPKSPFRIKKNITDKGCANG